MNAAKPEIVLSANSCWNLVNFRGALLKGLQERGFQVTGAAPLDGSEGLLSRAGAAVEPIAIRSDGLNPLEDARLAVRYWRLLRRRRPAAFCGFTAKPNVYGCLAAGQLGIPAIANVSGLGTAFIRGGSLEKLITGLYTAAFRRAALVFFQNREDRALFVDRGIVRPEQAGLLPGSGVDLARFRPTRRSGDATGETRFLFVGRLIGDKGVREFADAARIVRAARPDCRFALLGPLGVANRTAITREELDGWVGEGILDYRGAADDVRPHLDWADAIVLPSYREGLSRVLLEGAAMERPLLASDVPGNRELVRDGVNGLSFSVRSADSMAEAMLRFAAMPFSQKQILAAAARRGVEVEFDEAIVVERYVNAIRAAIGPAAG
ncbi:glycosyltransferase family 1 protein [Sphingomonas ginkgonis]|uniref:Glycosyltransferase family 1 protein n=1 Tax=Sphingomonas ginkgonis TaxID=2315330 RepID=A0A429VAJ9_9SPHN|nr:glycosyltransferase family 4 protein [Sphingomonas ginkgonis]RST31001.1 glycosyltransferase family 1 protein [Sphingomonas ginkgonis]